MDHIKAQMDNLTELTDEQVEELQASIVSEFETVESADATPESVDAMTTLADMLDATKGELARREAQAEELVSLAAQAAERVHGTESVEAAAETEVVEEEEVPAEEAPVEEAPVEVAPEAEEAPAEEEEVPAKPEEAAAEMEEAPADEEAPEAEKEEEEEMEEDTKKVAPTATEASTDVEEAAEFALDTDSNAEVVEAETTEVVEEFAAETAEATIADITLGSVITSLGGAISVIAATIIADIRLLTCPGIQLPNHAGQNFPLIFGVDRNI